MEIFLVIAAAALLLGRGGKPKSTTNQDETFNFDETYNPDHSKGSKAKASAPKYGVPPIIAQATSSAIKTAGKTNNMLRYEDLPYAQKQQYVALYNKKYNKNYTVEYFDKLYYANKK